MLKEEPTPNLPLSGYAAKRYARLVEKFEAARRRGR
jgi:hypothetical protein